MGIKIILLSVVMAHTCTATINESNVSSFEEADDPIDYNDLSDELYIWENPETNPDSGSPASSYNKTFNRSSSTMPTTLCFVLVTVPPFCPGGFLRKKKPRASKKTNTSEAAAYSHNTTVIPEIFNISDEAVLFLKGLMVTRVMPSFYIFITLISLPLNALALVTFTCRIREKKPAVIYMSHLACADLLFTLLLPLKIHYQLNASDWVFGEAACRVLSAAYYCYMYCSILLMMCMSVDRLLAVALPIASLTWRSARKATCVCVLVWLLALAGTVPLLSMTQTVKIRDVGITCHDVPDQTQKYVYLFSILSCLYFFLPLVVTLVSSFTIIYVLSVKSNRLAKSSSSSDNRRRAVIMVITVLMEFVVCFAPTNGILLYHCVRLATGGEGDSSYAAYLLAVCLGSASVFLDPLLYYYGSSQCRQQIRSVFWGRKAKRAKTSSNI
ncbi:proteinase-activated receptor 1-like [Rhinichthys klamathensis goyatoka]|uniref:proteinase-activated receptor 1-like n=1 Tax=Rhinichthys klamathensis goyatoka TaxID=3034132 RepID=UPI0024B5B45F|nr:proteinase-activated receptor 1-like [Rhinichthys klamathensis goyatoka]